MSRLHSSAVLDRAERVSVLAHEGHVGLASLEISGFVRPGLDSDRYVARLDRMAERVDGTTHLALRRVIAIADGYGGNVEDYYAPENSFLDHVLDSRRGIPITLSIIWMEVGRRAGIEVVGVGLPGHFVVYAAGQMVDPFHYGEAIGFDEAASLVASALGGHPRLDKSWLSPVETPEVIRRLLRNLEGIYRERGDALNLEWVAACLERLG